MQGAQLEPQMGSGGYLFMMAQLLALSQGWMVSAALCVTYPASPHAVACIQCRCALLHEVRRLTAAAAAYSCGLLSSKAKAALLVLIVQRSTDCPRVAYPFAAPPSSP